MDELLPSTLKPAQHGPNPSNNSRPQRRGSRNLRFSRIPRLLFLGYSTKELQRQYESQKDWTRFHAVMLRKLENIAIVSGLLLVANVAFLVAQPSARMTYASVAASVYLSLLSLFFDLMCVWPLVGSHPTRLEYLVRNSSLFYYLYGTPSLFGGASALSFFVAVGSWTWLDEQTGQFGWGGKVCSVILASALMFNVGICFYLGASIEHIPLTVQNPCGSVIQETTAPSCGSIAIPATSTSRLVIDLPGPSLGIEP